jgi:hypothetical protein
VDVAQEMLDSDFLRFHRADGALNVFKLHRASAVFRAHLLHADIRFGGQSRVAGGLYLDNHQHRIAAVPPKQLVNINVVWANTRSAAVPSNNALARIHFAKHCKHLLVKVVVNKPNLGIARILLKRHWQKKMRRKKKKKTHKKQTSKAQTLAKHRSKLRRTKMAHMHRSWSRHKLRSLWCPAKHPILFVEFLRQLVCNDLSQPAEQEDAPQQSELQLFEKKKKKKKKKKWYPIVGATTATLLALAGCFDITPKHNNETCYLQFLGSSPVRLKN